MKIELVSTRKEYVESNSLGLGHVHEVVEVASLGLGHVHNLD